MITPEQATIAAVLLDSKVLRFALDECGPDDFEDMRLGEIFRLMIAMVTGGEGVDVITVGSNLALWEIRGVDPAELHAWISEVPTAMHVSGYARQVRQGALRRGVNAIATTMVAINAQNPSDALSRATRDIAELRAHASSTTAIAKTLGEVLLGEDDYDWVVENLLERGDRLLLTGVEGGGKSMLVRQIAIMSSAGLHPFTFHPMKPAKVLVVDAENSERQWRRASKQMVAKAALIGSKNPADVLRLWCEPKIDLTRDSDLANVHRLIDMHKPDILFIGPLYRLIPKSINSDDDAAPLLAALDSLRERGVAMVIEAHAGHAMGAGGERDLRPRGSAALLGWPEFGLGLRPDKKANSSNAFQLVRWRGDRDKRDWPSRISRGMSDWPWTPAY